MKKKDLLYKAIGGIKDGMVSDAAEYEAEKRDFSRLRTVLEAVAVVAVVCGFVVLSMVLTKISGPKTDPAASGEISTAETKAETDTAMETIDIDSDQLSRILEEFDKTKNIYVTPEDKIDYEQMKEDAKELYDHPDTTKTQFKILDRFDTNEYVLFDPVIVRPEFYFDDNYEKKPVYTEDSENPVWYKTPYVRYQVSGFPERFGKEKYVTHVDICGLDDVAVCGITINSTFEEFEETFTKLGYNVDSYESSVIPYSPNRKIIKAEKNGLWIILEKASNVRAKLKAYGDDTSFIQYDDDIVPAIIRIGVAVENLSPVEQYELP